MVLTENSGRFLVNCAEIAQWIDLVLWNRNNASLQLHYIRRILGKEENIQLSYSTRDLGQILGRILSIIRWLTLGMI